MTKRKSEFVQRSDTLQDLKKKNSVEKSKTIRHRPMKRQNTRKYGYCSEQIHQNLILIFGCPASKTVKAETDMVSLIAEAFTTRFNTDDLTLHIPGVFENLRLGSTDAKFEMSISNNI